MTTPVKLLFLTALVAHLAPVLLLLLVAAAMALPFLVVPSS